MKLATRFFSGSTNSQFQYLKSVTKARVRNQKNDIRIIQEDV